MHHLTYVFLVFDTGGEHSLLNTYLFSFLCTRLGDRLVALIPLGVDTPLGGYHMTC